MKKVFILTNSFPYGKGEVFLKEELYYHKNVSIISTYIGRDKSRTNLSSDLDVEVLHPTSKYFYGNRLNIVLKSLLSIFSIIFWRELFGKDIRPIKWKKIRQLLISVGKIKQIEKFCESKINEIQDKTLDDEYIFYSYWMNHLAVVATRLANKYNGKAVSRCHGYDLYKRKENNDYVVFQSYLCTKLNGIFPISTDGQRVLSEKAELQYIEVSHLGTRDYGLAPVPNEQTIFTIVSCSNVIPLKRVGLIFDSIKRISDFKIKWIHFGEGNLLEDLKNRIEREFCRHDIILTGSVSNEEIMNFYLKHPVNLFVNLSESEGIPVSIMEAISFGIPCLATKVGGIPEIIDEKNGVLLSRDCDSLDVARSIMSIKEMKKTKYQMMRQEARIKWQKNFSANNNYSKFVDKLSKI